MTSRRQRQQPIHHIGCYIYPPSVSNDDFHHVAEENFLSVRSYSNAECTDVNTFECNEHIGSHFRDASAIASSSSDPSLRSGQNQTKNAITIDPSSSVNLSSTISNNQAEHHPINIPSMIHSQYNNVGQSSYQKKRKRELLQHL